MGIKVEYRVRKVERYLVTRWYSVDHGDGREGGCDGWGEFDNADIAYDVAYALARNEHEVHGWPAGDERMKYPRHPNEENAQQA